MFRTYYWKMFYCTKISVSLYHMGWQFSCHHITCRNIILRNYHRKVVLSQIVYCAKISLSLYYKGWQFSCHLTTGRNVKDSSLENVLRQIVYCTKISVRSYYKRWQFCCQLIWFKAYTFVFQNTHKLKLLLCNFLLQMKQYLATYRLLHYSVDVLM